MRDKRLNKPQHIKALMQEQINLLRKNEDLDPINKARAIAYLSNIALTAIKDGELEERLKHIEEQLEGE